ncbi:MAG: hypothetical protein Q7T11_03745 [Deltaproteobacteria bacterium]|nr:hypothetical protein [Deltaproteobacteria bacterium]
MSLKKNLYKNFIIKDCPPVKIGPLNIYKCNQCDDGIYKIASENLIDEKLSEHIARCDAKTTPVAEVIHVSEASKVLHMSRQGVIKLMKKGKLPYVFFGNSRVPKRSAVLQYSSSRR